MFELAQPRLVRRVLELCGLDAIVFPPVVESGTVVGAVTAEAAAATGLPAGHARRRRRGRHPARPRRHRRRSAGPVHRSSAAVSGSTVVLDEPLIDPRARLRTLCHTVPGHWMMEGIGFYCGIVMRWFRDAFCELEAPSRSGRVRTSTRSWRKARLWPAGSQRRLRPLLQPDGGEPWVHGPPGFLGFDVANPTRAGRTECFRAIEESAAYVTRGHLGIVEEVAGARVDEPSSPAEPRRARCGRRSWQTCSGFRCASRRQGVHCPRGRDLRGCRGRLYDDAGETARSRCGSSGRSSRMASTSAYREPLRAVAASSTAARSSSPRPASCALSGAPREPDRTRGRGSMPEADSTDDKSFYADIPAPDQGFFLKGSRPTTGE